MPNKALTFCKHHGCNRLTNQSYCETHIEQHKKDIEERQRAYNRSRESTAKQGYDHNWVKVRNRYIRLYPLCEICEQENRTTPATIVHHLVALRDNGDRLSFDNLQSVCHQCHEKIHGEKRWHRR